MTTPQDHDKVSELFLSACKLASAARGAFLDEHCADNPELRAEVEVMLGRDACPDSFLKTRSPGTTAQSADFDDRDDQSVDGTATHDEQTDGGRPERIGQYTIREALGEGGMGIVYLAEQNKPRRKVALKVIKPGMDSRAVIARFEAERQALALTAR